MARCAAGRARCEAHLRDCKDGVGDLVRYAVRIYHLACRTRCRAWYYRWASTAPVGSVLHAVRIYHLPSRKRYRDSFHRCTAAE